MTQWNDRTRLVAVVVSLSTFCGCGSPLVEPDSGGVSHRSAPPAAAIPAGTRDVTSANSPGATTESIPQLPADEVVSLPEEPDAVYHEVKTGDTLSAIAKRYQSTVNAITEANGISAETPLQPGQLLFIPSN